MKSFLIKLLLIFFYIFIFISILEFFIFNKNINQYSFKHNLLKNEKQTEVLILGNSHMLFGIKPSLLSFKAINIANKSRKIETDYFILKKHIFNLKELKTVILPISFYTMFTEELSDDEKNLYYNFYKLNQYKQTFIKDRLVINNPFNELINNIEVFSDAKNKLSKHGWRANSDKYKFNFYENKERLGNIKQKINNKNIIKNNIYTLQKIIDLCEHYKVQLLLILPPYHPDFYKYDGKIYSNKINEIIQTNITLKSAFLLKGEKLHIKKSDLFENIDHLNKDGAKIFTSKIDSILKLLIN